MRSAPTHENHRRRGARGVLVNRHRTADTPNLAAQGQSVSRKTVAEVPLTGLSFLLLGRKLFGILRRHLTQRQLLLHPLPNVSVPLDLLQ